MKRVMKKRAHSESEKDPIINYKKLYLSNVPVNMTLKTIIRDYIDGFPFISIQPFRNKINPEFKSVVIEFVMTCLASAALKVINTMRTKGVVAKYFIDDDAKEISAPSLSDQVKRHKLDYDHQKIRCKKSGSVESDDDDDEDEEEEEKIQGRCSYCLKDNVKQACSNCLTSSTATFYCGPDHQEKHWAIHRWDCIRPSKLLFSSEIIDKREEMIEKIQAFEPDDPERVALGEFVKITHIKESNYFYVRSQAHKDMEILEKLEKDKTLHTTPLIEPPRCGNIQYVPFEGRYCRGQIKTFNDFTEKCSVLLIDHGITLMNIDWTTLKKMRNKDRRTPKYTQRVTLEGVELVPNPSQTLEEYLEKLQHEILKVIFVTESKMRKQNQKGTTMVKLLRSNGKIVNDEINSFNIEPC